MKRLIKYTSLVPLPPRSTAIQSCIRQNAQQRTFGGADLLGAVDAAMTRKYITDQAGYEHV